MKWVMIGWACLGGWCVGHFGVVGEVDKWLGVGLGC